MYTSREKLQRDATILASTIAALLMLLCVTGSASAQVKLGRLKSVAAKALPAALSPSAGGEVKTGSVTFDERVLEITAERLDQFMAGLDAETEMAAKVNGQDLDAIDRANAAADAAYDKEMEAYEAKVQQHDKCTGTISKNLEKQMAPSMPTEQDRAKMEAVAARIKSAKEAGNMTEVRRLMDSLVAAMNPATMRLVAASNNAVARANTECGAEPVKPATPSRRSALTWSDVTSAGTRASRMDQEQYAILRERVVPFVLSQGKSSNMMYTSSELGALKSKLESLSKYESILKNN
jgi:transketolase